MDKGAEALTTSASLDPKDPASEEKMQESTFELMAITTLLDVEGTVVAAARRVLLDNGHDETAAQAPSSSPSSTKGVVDEGGIGSFFGTLFSTSSTPSNSATGSTDGTPVAMDATAVHTTRCEALLILANILETAKSSNPDPYSWRTAFAQAAAATAR